MFTMKQMIWTADARFAPVCQSAMSCGMTLSIHDTAVEAVSFLLLGVRICLLGLVRIILPKAKLNLIPAANVAG